MAPYTEVFVACAARAEVLPGIQVQSDSLPPGLVEFPLNELFVLTPFNEKLLLVSRFPFAEIA